MKTIKRQCEEMILMTCSIISERKDRARIDTLEQIVLKLAQQIDNLIRDELKRFY